MTTTLSQAEVNALPTLSTQQVIELYDQRETDYRSSIQCKLHHSTISSLLKTNEQLVSRIDILEAAANNTAALYQLIKELQTRLLKLEQQTATSAAKPSLHQPTSNSATSGSQSLSKSTNRASKPNIPRPPKKAVANTSVAKPVNTTAPTAVPTSSVASTSTTSSTTTQQKSPTLGRKSSPPSDKKKTSPRSNNLLIYGLPVTDDKNDAAQVIKILHTLEIDTNKMISHRRIPHKDSSVSASKPPVVIIELDSNDTRKLALKNINKVIRNDDFPNCYVLPDRTPQQLKIDKLVREKRDLLNMALELEHTTSSGHKYKYAEREDGSKYYWGITNGDVVQKPFTSLD
jgi:hypothetical protein